MTIRAALDVVLSGEGFFSVTGFVEGETFLSAARARTPGCVLIDVHLPGCSGIDVLRKLDAQHYPAPILAISGTPRHPDRDRRDPQRQAGLHRKTVRPG